MKRALLLVGLVAFACMEGQAVKRHYSFVGGYPADGIRAESAKARESGGANLGASAVRRHTVTRKESVVVITNGTPVKVSKPKKKQVRKKAT